MAITVVDNMEGTAGWGNSAVTTGDQNGVSLNTTTYVQGTAAVNMAVDVSLNAADRAAFARTSGSVDLSSVADTGYIKFWVYIPDVTHFTNVAFQFGSDTGGGNDRYYNTGRNKTANGENFSDGWNQLQYNWATDFTKQGTPDNSALDYWFFQFNYTSSFADATLIVDYIRHDTAPETLTRDDSDNVGITDSFDQVMDLARSSTDNVGVTDNLDRSMSIVRTLSDAVDLTDSLVGGLVVFLELTDNVGITDSTDLVMSLARSIQDNVGITDTVTRVVSLNRSFADTLGLTDTLNYTTFIELALSDSVGITDELAYVLRTVGSPFVKLIIIDDELDSPPKIKDITETDPIAKMDSVE